MKGHLAWDDDNLYLGVQVIDATFVAPRSKDFWNEDSLQLAIDADNDAKADAGYDDDDYELGAAIYKGRATVAWSILPATGQKDATAGIQIAIVPTMVSPGMIYEVAIPKSCMPHLKLEAGRIIGFSLLINDNDGYGRKGWWELTPGIGLGKNPADFQDVLLQD